MASRGARAGRRVGAEPDLCRPKYRLPPIQKEGDDAKTTYKPVRSRTVTIQEMIRGLGDAYRRSLVGNRPASIQRILVEASDLMPNEDLDTLRKELLTIWLATRASRYIQRLPVD